MLNFNVKSIKSDYLIPRNNDLTAFQKDACLKFFK